jgi:hypothetical protein
MLNEEANIKRDVMVECVFEGSSSERVVLDCFFFFFWFEKIVVLDWVLIRADGDDILMFMSREP